MHLCVDFTDILALRRAVSALSMQSPETTLNNSMFVGSVDAEQKSAVYAPAPRWSTRCCCSETHTLRPACPVAQG